MAVGGLYLIKPPDEPDAKVTPTTASVEPPTSYPSANGVAVCVPPQRPSSARDQVLNDAKQVLQTAIGYNAQGGWAPHFATALSDRELRQTRPID